LNQARNAAKLLPTFNGEAKFMAGIRKGFGCRLFPADIPCEFDVWEDDEEVLEIAVEHAGEFHGLRDTPALREDLRSMMRVDRRGLKAA
jgi:predicted small metal-binding protein